MNKLQDVSLSELQQVEGGTPAIVIAVGLTIGMAVAGAFVIGYVAGATGDECKKK